MQKTIDKNATTEKYTLTLCNHTEDEYEIEQLACS